MIKKMYSAKLIAILPALCLTLFGTSAYSKTKLGEAEGKRKPASGSDEYLAAAIFSNFIKCGGQENKNKAETEKCVSRFFAPSVSPVVVSAYVDTLTFPNEYSEPYYCDAETTARVKRFEETPFDVMLCFESNVMAPSKRQGVVLFKRGGGAPLIVRIKI